MDKFWNKVNKTPGCWEWTGHRLREGYGRLRMGSRTDGTRRQELAHRVSYELHRGEIPPGLIVRHTCDNPSCVNPDHLELGTDADNARDKAVRDRAVTKLSPVQVNEIRERRDAGERLKTLAAEYGVRESTISRIANRRRRKHV